MTCWAAPARGLPRPDEGLGVTEDKKGFMIMWAGYRVRLLDAAQAALALSRDLTKMFWGPLTQP